MRTNAYVQINVTVTTWAVTRVSRDIWSISVNKMAVNIFLQLLFQIFKLHYSRYVILLLLKLKDVFYSRLLYL